MSSDPKGSFTIVKEGAYLITRESFASCEVTSRSVVIKSEESIAVCSHPHLARGVTVDHSNLRRTIPCRMFVQSVMRQDQKILFGADPKISLRVFGDRSDRSQRHPIQLLINCLAVVLEYNETVYRADHEGPVTVLKHRTCAFVRHSFGFLNRKQLLGP